MLALLLAVVVLCIAVPPLRARAKAAAVLARSVGIPFPRPFAQRVAVRRGVLLAPDVRGDLYSPGPAPPLLLVSGATPQGAEDPRLVRVARALAGARRQVFAPQLELRHQTFQWSDEVRLVRSIRALSRMEGGAKVGVVGFSYGGSFCLLAAEDPAASHMVAFVAVFGSFDDLLGVVQGITTGATTYRGRLVPWRTVPEARSIMNRAAVGLAPAGERAALSSALSPGDPAALPPDMRSVFDLLENRDPRRTYPLAARTPPSFLATLRLFSPATHLRMLRAPLFVMQSESDPATPPTEALRFRDSVPGARLILLRWFEHVNPPGTGTPVSGELADGWGAWRFVSWVLAAQERFWP